MQTFNVYPKKGEMFSLEFETFQLAENGFILFNNAHQASKEGFISFDNVAAIIPEQQTGLKDMICFHVYLKDKSQPIEVFASSFDIEQESSVTFLWQQTDIVGTIIKEDVLLGIYIAPSEVVAIMPSDGLLSYRR